MLMQEAKRQRGRLSTGERKTALPLRRQPRCPSGNPPPPSLPSCAGFAAPRHEEPHESLKTCQSCGSRNVPEHRCQEQGNRRVGKRGREDPVCPLAPRLPPAAPCCPHPPLPSEGTRNLPGTTGKGRAAAVALSITKASGCCPCWAPKAPSRGGGVPVLALQHLHGSGDSIPGQMAQRHPGTVGDTRVTILRDIKPRLPSLPPLPGADVPSIPAG